MIARAVVDVLRRPRGPAASLRDAAIGAYGRTIAETFLVSYSEKLWGVDAARLSPEVAGKRLRGLDLRTLWIEAVRGARAKTAHLDGDFLYPRGGIGGIADALARACPAAALRTDSRATRIVWKGLRVERVWLAGAAGRGARPRSTSS